RSVQDDCLRPAEDGHPRCRVVHSHRGGGRRPGAQKGGGPMIRINLLTTEKERAKGPRVAPFATANAKIAVGCSLILVAAATLEGTRYYKVNKESATLDAQIADAQQETSRLHSIILQVQQFEQRRAQLQQRVVLIEQLRKGQTGPVHMLDQISRS